MKYSNQIDVFKGLSMAMIVFAHNPALVGGNGLDIQAYFYGFHVANFFLLSFILNNKEFSFDVIKKQMNRLIKPMLIFMLISGFLYNIYIDVDYDLYSVIKMFSFHAAEIKFGFGFKAFWFPVTFLSFYILCLFFNSQTRVIKLSVIALSVVVHVFYTYIYDNNILLPGAILIAAYMLPIAIFTKTFTTKLLYNELNKYIIIPSILFVFVLFIYKDYSINIGSFRFYSPIDDIAGYLVSLLFMQLGFLVTWYLSVFLRNSHFLETLGKFSYQVYFIHLFINFVLVTFIDTIYIDNIMRIFLSVVVSIITLLISMVVSKEIMRNRLLSRMF